jgi:hypothetical protein
LSVWQREGGREGKETSKGMKKLKKRQREATGKRGKARAEHKLRAQEEI